MTGEEFKQRFLPFSQKLYKVALKLSGNTQEAEDIVQDAYMKLWDRRNGLPDTDNTEAYCVAITKNICYDRLRRKRHGHDSCPQESLQIPADGNMMTEMETKDYAGIMRCCIDRLPAQQRMIITMRDVNGLSFDEIENATGLNAVNIRVVLSRARKILRNQFNAIKNYGDRQDKKTFGTVL